MNKQYLETGKIVGTHALKGEVKIIPWSDNADFFYQFSNFYIKFGDYECVKVESLRTHKNLILAKFEGIDSINEANNILGKIIYINREQIDLDEGRYFFQDLIGLSMVDVDNGYDYGKVTDIIRNGLNELYQIKNKDNKTYLVPAVSDIVLKVDIENQKIYIRPIKGLFEI